MSDIPGAGVQGLPGRGTTGLPTQTAPDSEAPVLPRSPQYGPQRKSVARTQQISVAPLVQKRKVRVVKPGVQGGGGSWEDAPTKSKGLRLPWYSDIFGEITRRSQLILLPTKVEQVTPKPRIDGGVNLSNPLPSDISAGILAEAYTGKSRDQAATVTGSVYKMLGTVWWNGGDMSNPNTFNQRVFVAFDIVTHPSGEQLVVFHDHVFKWINGGANGATIAPPELILETSALMLDPETDAPMRWEAGASLGGPTGVEWWDHPDIQVGIVGLYDSFDNLIGWKYADGDLEYANAASEAYLVAHSRKYQLTEGRVNSYPFILPWECDGLTQQITWTMGAEGPSTVASMNTEHSAVVLKFPDRRRNELLPPNKEAAAANARERDWVDKKIPKGGGNPK